MTVTSRVRLAGLATLLAIVAQAAVGQLGAQGLQLKRPTFTPITITCPVFPPPAQPIQQLVEESGRLATLGQEAALEGDHRSARDLFSQAAQLNPHDPALAYRLGREYEETGQKSDALRQYCRYLSLAPGGADAPQVTNRAAQLVTEPDLARGTQLVEQFHAGVTHFDAREWSPAVDAFGQVVTGAPSLPSAVYDRALAHDRNGDDAAAIRDYSRYLALDPSAEDADSVSARMRVLRQRIPNAGTAFALGILPGGGQFYTGQPLLGAAVIAGTAGGIVLALQTKVVTRDTTYTGPFGGTYTGTYQQRTYPNFALGIGIAAGVTLLGAVQAAIVAGGRSAGLNVPADTTTTPQRSSMLPHAGPVTLELPTVIPSPRGSLLAFPIRISVQ